MKIRVRLIGQFMARFGFGEDVLEVPSPCTVAGLVSRLEMEDLEKIVTRDGQPLAEGDPLEDGDRVVIAPIFSGG